MEMIIDFPGGARVDAHFGPYTIPTDQPPTGGGDGSAPTPFRRVPVLDGHLRGYLCAGLLPPARTLYRWHSHRAAHAQQPAYRHGRQSRSGDPGAGFFPGKIPPFAGQVGRTMRGEKALRAPAYVRYHDQRS
jgi:hypothetical protein